MNTSEYELLSIIAQNPDWQREHASQLSPVLFASEQRRLIYEAVAECGQQWDAVSITNTLRTRGKLDAVGGPAGVSEYFMHFPIISMGEHHLHQVREAAGLRRTLEVMQRATVTLTAAIENGVADGAALVEGIKEQLEGAGKLPGKKLRRLTCAAAMEEALTEIEERAKHPGEIPGITTGFPKLDQITLGLQPGHLWVIAGGPSDGKSTLMQNILEGAAETGASTAIYQLEMPIHEQAMRLLVSDAGVSSQALKTGRMTGEEQVALMASMKRLKGRGVDFIDTDGVTADDILADIEQASYSVVMVDYLQLLDIAIAKGGTREQAISDIARKLKNLAKRKNLTMLTGSQLNDDGMLRESRAIGQHADKVIMVKPVAVDGEPDQTQRRLLVGKNRGGPRGAAIPLRFTGASFRFRESSDDDGDEGHWIDEMEKKQARSATRTR